MSEALIVTGYFQHRLVYSLFILLAHSHQILRYLAALSFHVQTRDVSRLAGTTVVLSLDCDYPSPSALWVRG